MGLTKALADQVVLPLVPLVINDQGHPLFKAEGAVGLGVKKLRFESIRHTVKSHGTQSANGRVTKHCACLPYYNNWHPS